MRLCPSQARGRRRSAAFPCAKTWGSMCYLYATFAEAARSQGLQGLVRMLVTIDSQGMVTNVETLTGPEILRQPAIDAVRKMQFRPVIRNGHPVNAYTDENVGFYIPGKPVVANFNIEEDRAAIQRIMDLEKRFPRSKQQVLADLEQDISGADARQRFYA